MDESENGIPLNISELKYNASPGVRYQSGYTKSNGTYVQPHVKTNSNSTNWDNFSTRGNVNSSTGTTGTRARDYSPGAYNYGAGKTIYTLHWTAGRTILLQWFRE